MKITEIIEYNAGVANKLKVDDTNISINSRTTAIWTSRHLNWIKSAFEIVGVP